MTPREFYELVKAQRKACKDFSRGRNAEEIRDARDRYYALTDQIDAEIARVDSITEEKQ